MNTTEKLTTEALQMRVDSYGRSSHTRLHAGHLRDLTKKDGYATAPRSTASPKPRSTLRPNARGRSECALELIAEADHLFADAGTPSPGPDPDRSVAKLRQSEVGCRSAPIRRLCEMC
ncbi:hypothetical protein [Trueperella pyogenes]|uniref:hypothetical protein n=1 Tax=Trueperella pyogenes TaxID=1661 RepID=UPI001F0C396D|nr:hypothetical protein [Trueperella pyogenes]